MQRTTCPKRQEMLEYTLGKLPDDASEALAEHIDACATCQAMLATLEDVPDTWVARLRMPAAPDPFADEPAYHAMAEYAKRLMPAPDAEATCSADSTATPPAPGAEEGAASADLGRLGEYELLAKLGEGGMGTVYRARHTKLKRIVALKVLTRERTNDPAAVARFEREMEAVGRVDHPHLVRAMDAREVDGQQMLVMEYVDGQDLGQIVAHHRALPIADACELVRQTAVGLQCVHENGLVHRDIKPSNLMLARIK